MFTPFRGVAAETAVYDVEATLVGVGKGGDPAVYERVVAFLFGGLEID